MPADLKRQERALPWHTVQQCGHEVRPLTTDLTDTANKRIITDPEAPGFVDPLLGVVDADARAASDSSGRNLFKVFDPNSIAQEIGAVEPSIDPHGDAEFAGTVGKIVIRVRMPARSHDLESFNRLDCADKNRMRYIGDVADDVELVVHAVDEINIRNAARSVHRLSAFCPPSSISM